MICPSFLPRTVFALVIGAIVSAVAPLRAQRMVVTEANAEPVVIESAAVATEVTGRFAVTTFDLVFRNPNARVLEGTFEFPLLDGQSVVRFALDIGGTLREAVPVEKARGRAVFEEIERRRVDPGLLEQTVGNNYRARVFPIPARGTRRLVIAYQEDVARRVGEPAYRLNLNFADELRKFRLVVTVRGSETEAAKARTTLALDLPAWREGRFLEIERTDFTARGLLELELPVMQRPSVLTGRHEDREYFYAEVPVTGEAQPRPAPRVVGLLWDSSGSGAERDHAREFALLEAWLKKLGDVEVRLMRLQDLAAAPVSFTVRQGSWKELRRELEKTVYDGATSLDGLTDDPAVEEWLLFSDGLLNYGASSRAPRLPVRGVVHAVLAAARADPAWLRGVASRHAGEFVDLLAIKPAEAAIRLRTASLRLVAVDHDPAEVAQVFPEPGAPIADGTLVVAGLLRSPAATVRLRVGHNAADAREIVLDLRTGENPSALAARGWATTKIRQLAVDLAANREDIRRTSQAFGVVTADTSLIVLETLQDYVRYDIAPPADLRQAWDTQRQTANTARQKDRDQHLATVVQLFQERVAWWEQKFPKDKPPAPPPESKKAVRDVVPRGGSAIEELRRESFGGAPAAVPAAAPAAVPSDTEVIQLSPFTVDTSRDRGYLATQSLSGSRVSARQEERLLREQTVSGSVLADTFDIPKMKDGTPEARSEASIALQRWSPQAGYLDHLRRASAEKRYDIYLEERADHARQPGFYLDVAEFFFEQGDAPHALRILSNLAELALEDVALLRVLGHRLVQADRADLAQPLFERVLALRPDEPQSHRDLALVCAALKQYQRAVDLLGEVVLQPWSDRFPEIELIALAELNAIAATCGQPLDLSKLDARLRRNLPVGLRAVLTWDADNCDIDLWVGDPNGEMAIYNHPRTYQGGRMSRDFTGGYGPEEFMLRDPKAGTYSVKINYYGDSRQTALGPVTVQVRLITGFGTPQHKEQRLTVRLTDEKEALDIGSIKIGSGQ